MQLDNTRIVIRERDFLDILDLSLRVMRFYVGPWAVLSFLGALPFALLNVWLLSPAGPVHALLEPLRSPHAVEPRLYLYRLMILTVWELPLAAAPLTRYFGHALFFDRPNSSRIARELRGALPQLIVYQVVLRGLFILPAMLDWWGIFLMILWLIPFARSPYLNEVILLERNPFFGQPGRMTTNRRSQSLHAGSRNTLFSRFLVSMIFGGAMVCGLALSMWYIRGVLTHHWEKSGMVYAIGAPAAMWIVAAFFAVVRYLSYLDLRIRREGWEVELQVRAEAERMAGVRLEA